MKKIEIIKHFETLLGCKLVITGSLALHYHGIKIPSSKIKDLDLLMLKPSTAAIDILQRLATETPKLNHQVYPGDLGFSIRFDGVDIDFIPMGSEQVSLYTIEGIGVSAINHIIGAKRGFSRPKDWMQLLGLSQQICSGSELKEAARGLYPNSPQGSIIKIDREAAEKDQSRKNPTKKKSN